MNIFFDTSVIVEVDRNSGAVISLLKKLVSQGHELLISTVTVAEILTGSYLRKDARDAVLKAKDILNQFTWKELDGAAAEKAAQLYAYLIVEKKEASVEYADVLIAATFLSSHADALITLNTKDFVVFPPIKDTVFRPEEFKK